MNHDNGPPGVRIPGDQQDSAIVPGAIGSAPCAKSGEGLVKRLPTGPSTESATVEDYGHLYLVRKGT